MLPSVLDTKTFSLVLSAWFVSYGSAINRLKKSCQKNLNGIRNREILSKILQSKNIHPTRSVYWRIQLYLWKFISKKFESGIKTNAKVNKFASNTSKRVEILKAKNTLKYELFFFDKNLNNTEFRNFVAKTYKYKIKKYFCKTPQLIDEYRVFLKKLRKWN